MEENLAIVYYKILWDMLDLMILMGPLQLRIFCSVLFLLLHL